MNRFPLFCVVALLGAAVSAPAQVSFEGRLGRNVRGSVSIDFGGHRDRDRGGDRDHDRYRSHNEPVRRFPVPVPVRGHWETVCEQVLVPGYWSEEHVPPTYGWVRNHCGRLEWGMVDPGGCRRVWVPPHYEHQNRRVWVGC
jgi:hypothetical protein